MSPDSIYPTTPSLNIRSLGGHTFVSHIRMGFKKWGARIVFKCGIWSQQQTLIVY